MTIFPGIIGCGTVTVMPPVEKSLISVVMGAPESIPSGER